jgi:hypothetical protein
MLKFGVYITMEVNGERTNYIKKMDSRFFKSNLDLPFGSYGFSLDFQL